MANECPYCGNEFSDATYLYHHAMTDHREAVLAHWIAEHGVTPRISGQQHLEAFA